MPSKYLGDCPHCGKKVTLAKPHVVWMDRSVYHTNCWLEKYPLPNPSILH